MRLLAEAPGEQVIDMLGDVAPAAVADPGERRKLAYLVITMAAVLYAGVWPFVLFVPLPGGSNGDPEASAWLVFSATCVYLAILAVAVGNMPVLRREKRSGGQAVGGGDRVPVIDPCGPLGLGFEAAVRPLLIEQVRPVVRHLGDVDPPIGGSAPA